MTLLVVAVVSLLVGLSVAGVQYEWGSPQIIGALALSAVSTAAFVAVELRAPSPIMPLGIYRNRIVSISSIAVLCGGFDMFGAIIFIPLFFQEVLGASATSSGSFLTPMMRGIVAGAALSGQALSRFGGHYRAQGVAGLAVMGVGMLPVAHACRTCHGPGPDNRRAGSTLLVGAFLGTVMAAVCPLAPEHESGRPPRGAGASAARYRRMPS